MYLAGQITGVEGYVESAASGLATGARLAERLLGRPDPVPPEATAFSALLGHLAKPVKDFQPSNVVWAMFPPMDDLPKKIGKREKHEKMAERALVALEPWLDAIGGAAIRERLVASR